jgi:hypothetical protein
MVQPVSAENSKEFLSTILPQILGFLNTAVLRQIITTRETGGLL